MNKIKNILIITFVCIGIFFIFDYIQYRITIKNPYEKPTKNYLYQLFSPNYYYSQSKTFQNKPFSYKLKTFRKNTNNKISNTKSPILIFGCSFAYGWLLEDKEVFSNRLSELTNRNTYNMSLPACGIQHMFHLLL